MHIVKFDLENGSVLFDSNPVKTDENGVLSEYFRKLCSPPIQTDEGHTRSRLLSKASVYGKIADTVIECANGRVHSVNFLFDLIEFFESSILESKILKACEKKLKRNFESDHPSNAFFNFGKYGQAIFFYDAKQGDLSLSIKFEKNLNPL